MPTRIDFGGGDMKLVKVYAGYSHSMAISNAHELYVWGDGKSGQLVKVIRKSDEPLLIEYFTGKDALKG